MIESQFGAAENYFLVNFDNGDVYLRRELYLNPNVDRYVVSIDCLIHLQTFMNI